MANARDLMARKVFLLLSFSAGLLALPGCRGASVDSSVKPIQPAPTGPIGPGMAQSEADGIRFEDVTKRAGITYVYPPQPKPMRNLEAFGCGCAMLDYDGDGWLDVLLVTKPHPILYRNRGDATFEDVTASSALGKLNGDWKGCTVGDYDNDGRLDIVLTGYRCLALLRNTDGKQFQDTTKQAGLDTTNGNHWGSSAGFMDLEGNGRLALVILNYVVFGPDTPQYCELTPGVKSGCPPQTYKPEFPELWQNVGNGKFRNVTASSGMKKTGGKALVLAFADADGDGKIDFYIGNDGTPAQYMRNLGGLKFENLGASSGTSGGITGHPFAAMGADWGDYNGDGRLDLAVSAFSNEIYALYENKGGNVFAHAEEERGIAGLTLNPLGFGTNWIDFDNDGYPDLVFANGHVYDNVHQIDAASTYKQPLLMLHNQAGAQFVDIATNMPPDVSRPMVGRGSAVGDIDNDGRQDILVVDYEGAPMLLHNTGTAKNHWLDLDLRMETENRFAYGATVTAGRGSRKWISTVSPAKSYESSSDPRIHFGTGADSVLDFVSIRWPDGRTETHSNVRCDNQYLIMPGRAPSRKAGRE